MNVDYGLHAVVVGWWRRRRRVEKETKPALKRNRWQRWRRLYRARPEILVVIVVAIEGS